MKYNIRKILLLGLTLSLTASLALAASPADKTSSARYSSSSSTSFYSFSEGTGSQNMTFHQVIHDSDGQHTSGMASFASSDNKDSTFAMTFSQQSTSGDMTGSANTTLTLTIKDHATWNGAMNADQKAKAAHLSIDKTSVWEVTGDSYLTTLRDTDQFLKNIHSNGHNIYYQPLEKDSQWLADKTYMLVGGGQLIPVKG